MKRIIAIGLLLWAFLTALTGFVNSFITIFVVRVFLGIIQAPLSPAQMVIPSSLLTSLFLILMITSSSVLQFVLYEAASIITPVAMGAIIAHVSFEASFVFLLMGLLLSIAATIGVRIKPAVHNADTLAASKLPPGV